MMKHLSQRCEKASDAVRELCTPKATQPPIYEDGGVERPMSGLAVARKLSSAIRSSVKLLKRASLGSTRARL
jgi:hypothetical protein